jgi:hypothetical protein
MSGYNVRTTDLSSDCLFPNTAAALIKQAKVFTGMEIVADPHWRAAPSLWGEGNGKDDYREMLSEVQKSVNSPYNGFVSQRAGMGAYIVYADHNDRWDGSLSTAEKNNAQADTLCHEIGHMLTTFPELQLTPPEIRYFCEQSAILAGAMLKTAVGNKGITYRRFPSRIQLANA